MKQSSMHALRHAAIAFAVMWTMASAWPAAAQVEDPADLDGDGVVDTLDQCLDTPPEDLIAADGCSVCPCDETTAGDPWVSHDAYVGCVAGEAHARRQAGTMRRREMRAAIRRARRSTCGDAALTRCCVYVHLDDMADVNVGQCRMIGPDECDALADQVDWSEDVGGGSCNPNPCLF